MFRLSANKISLAASALLLCAGFAQAATPVSPLTASPTSVALTFAKPSTAGGAVSVTFKVTSGTTYFEADPTTVPPWLNVGSPSGPATSSGATVSFQANIAAAQMSAGTYSANVHFDVSTFPDFVLPISLVVTDPASTVTVAGGTVVDATHETVAISWTQGTAYPTTTLTVSSSDQPVSFSVASSVTSPAAPNWINLSQAGGIAYTFGTPITVSFLSDVLYNAAIGSSLTGTVTITPSNGAPAIAVAFTITVAEPPASVTSIFPTQTPVQASGTLSVVVSGAGFSTSGSVTTVLVSSAALTTPTDLTTLTGGAVNVVNPNTMVLTIPVSSGGGTPAAILSAAGAVTLSIQNGSLGSAVSKTLTVTTNPIIYSVTDAGSLVEPVAGATPTFAPYELITIFGGNFGPVAGTPVQGTLDSNSRYPASLSTAGGTLTVAFNKATGTTLIANAYLLFATDSQINLLVPSGVTGNTTANLVVTVGAASTAAFDFNVAAANPGLFTTTSSGTGQGAILNSDFSVNSAAKPAKAGSTVMIYVSGLGAPDSVETDTNLTTAAAFPASCITPASYVAKLGLTPATIDGAVLLAADIATGHLPPCFDKIKIGVTIGGQTATITYAGWVADSVAGLYQINATVPAKLTAGNSQAVIVTVGTTATSQTGVTMATN
jgi:trimeric autotransporter adhesin